jgi:hypothetical protein
MKIKMCRCLWSGLVRPEGAIKIKKTRVLAPDVLVAKLSGRVNAKVAVVQVKDKFYFKGPKALGGICEVPADHLTDAINYRIWELNHGIGKKKAK